MFKNLGLKYYLLRVHGHENAVGDIVGGIEFT